MKNHISFLKECAIDSNYGYIKWNKWRKKFNIKTPKLQNAQLNDIKLHNYNFSGTDFSNAILIDCNFKDANLSNTNFEKAHCSSSKFDKANLKNVKFNNAELINVAMPESDCSDSTFINSSIVQCLLTKVNFSNVNFTNSKVIFSNLVNCNLTNTIFINTYLSGSNISRSNLNYSTIKDSKIYGLSAWSIKTEHSKQENLTITNNYDESVITVDDLEIANFIYLISNNKKISNTIDSITTKIVLILGRFKKERLEVLNHIKSVIKEINYVPVLFDFDIPETRDITETIGLIGRMSKFIIADLSDAKSIPQELSEIIPNNPSIKVYPIIEKENKGYSMFEHWEKYPWVVEKFEYNSKEELTKYIHSIDSP